MKGRRRQIKGGKHVMKTRREIRKESDWWIATEVDVREIKVNINGKIYDNQIGIAKIAPTGLYEQ